MSLFCQWFAMHGYARYIWPAYGLVIAVLIFNVIYINKQRIRVQQATIRWLKNR